MRRPRAWRPEFSRQDPEIPRRRRCWTRPRAPLGRSAGSAAGRATRSRCRGPAWRVGLRGDGSQTRSFCYVADLIDGIYRLLRSDVTEPVNIGNPAELSVLDFAKTIRKLTGTSSEIVFKPLPVDDPKVRQPDIAKARAKLGWQPKVRLEEGLAKTIDYFRALPAEVRAARG